MSGVQRWDFVEDYATDLSRTPDGDYVLFTDHEADHEADKAAAVEQAHRVGSRNVCSPCWMDSHDSCYGSEKCWCRACSEARVRADALREAAEAVEGVEHWASYSPDGDVWACFASDPIAAIRALPGYPKDGE